MPAAPYVFGAYVGIWIVLAVYTLMLSCRSKQTARDLDALKQALADREEKLER